MGFKEYLESEMKRLQAETVAIHQAIMDEGRNVLTTLELIKLQDLAKQVIDMKAALRAYKAWEKK